LTSGGDAPGMNAAIRAVVRRGIYGGHEVFGIRRGFNGLISGDIQQMHLGSVADIIHRGGTILHTARSERFKTPEGQKEAVEVIRKNGLDAVVVIGGDGSLRGAKALADRGVPVACIPASIDNDIACTSLSIGFDTAVNTIVEAIDKVRDTATSHERTFVLEVMGRERGFLALTAGIAGGAESILIPEIPVNMEDVCKRLLRGHQRGKTHSVIIVAEGAANGFYIAEEIRRRIGFETRVTVLGHIQRGGTPTALDRTLASRMGAKAVELLASGEGGVMVGTTESGLMWWDIDYVLEQKKDIDPADYQLAGILAI